MKAHRQKSEKRKEGDTDVETMSNFDFRGWLSPLMSPSTNYRGFRAVAKASPGSNKKKQQRHIVERFGTFALSGLDAAKQTGQDS